MTESDHTILMPGAGKTRVQPGLCPENLAIPSSSQRLSTNYLLDAMKACENKIVARMHYVQRTSTGEPLQRRQVLITVN